jgi:hypothetical protein
MLKLNCKHFKISRNKKNLPKNKLLIRRKRNSKRLRLQRKLKKLLLKFLNKHQLKTKRRLQLLLNKVLIMTLNMDQMNMLKKVEIQMSKLPKKT